MDVGQSPIQFIDQPGTNSRTPNSYYYGNSNNTNQMPSTSSIGALSTRLHQLRPAGSVPFSSRTNPNQISSSTMPRQKPSSNLIDNDLSNYQYNIQTLPLTTQYPTNKSISSQNLSSLGNQYNTYRDRLPLDSQLMLTNPINERPRPASARDTGFTDMMDMPASQQRRLYETLYTPRHSQPTHQKSNSSRFRQQRSSSFDYERDVGGSMRPAIAMPPPMAPNIYPGLVMGSNAGYDYHFPMMDNVIIDYQTDLFSIQRELAKCQQELELTKEKLASSLNSIKSFWSPELKRERSMRKDENAKYVLLAEELHQLQMEKKVIDYGK